jgi:hypothetical protein
MEGSRLTRYLHIAVTALCLTACVLLVALWVRSYSWIDSATLFGKYSIASFRGDILFNRPMVLTYSGPTPPRLSPPRYGITSIPAGQSGLIIFEGGWAIPHWLSILPMIAIGMSSWFRWHFSLRTLLIATTLIAVGLAVVVYAAR